MDEINERKWCVYMHTNKTNNKVYIGVTSLKPQERWHKDGSGYKRNKYFWRAIKKYGWDGFEHIIFAEDLTKEEACKMEIGLIALYQSNNSSYGYNLSTGGEGGGSGIPWSDEQRKALSNKFKGRILSDEWKAKIGKANTGKHHSEETRRKLSEQRAGELNSFYGKTHTQETKNKMSEIKKGKPVTERQLECLELGRGTKYWTQETFEKLAKMNCGEKSRSAKLTEENVIDILKMIQQHIPYVEIKKKYPIQDSQISRIKHKERWGYLYEKYPELYA